MTSQSFISGTAAPFAAKCSPEQTHGSFPKSYLLKISLDAPVPKKNYIKQMVELKNGETFNGHLVNCDNFMNITLREVYQTNSEGDRFWKVKECYIRGS